MSNASPAATDFGGPFTALLFGSLGAVSLFRGDGVDAAVWLALAAAFLAAPLRIDPSVRLGGPRIVVSALLCAVAAAAFAFRVATDLAT